MSDNKKRILIVDDDLTTRVPAQYLFKNAGFDAEVYVALDMERGMKKLEEWAAQGHAADIVDIDYFVRAGDGLKGYRPYHGHDVGGEGVRLTSHLMDWAQTQPETLRPKKYFLHSQELDEVLGALNKAGDAFKAKVEVLNCDEFHDIGRFGQGDAHASISCRDTTMRDYLNASFGARYPVTDAQVRQLSSPEEFTLQIGEMHHEVAAGTLPVDMGFRRLDTHDLAKYFRDHIDYDAAEKQGVNMSWDAFCFANSVGHAVSGALAFNAGEAMALRQQGKKAILVLENFTPGDTELLSLADGIILLGKGTEHLEVVVANHNIPAVMGNESGLRLEEKDGKKHLICEGTDTESSTKTILAAGDAVTLDQRGISTAPDDTQTITGSVFNGALPIITCDPFSATPGPSANQKSIARSVLNWADEARVKHGGMKVRANADTPAQVREAIRLGAEGVGLLRTEHMFFGKERMPVLQQALLSDDRTQAFAQLKAFQKKDFHEIFEAASQAGRAFPLTIRLLDAPPEEFLDAGQISTLRSRIGTANMRGVQLAGRIPGLYAMQTEAIFEAAKETGYKGQLEIMVPLIRTVEEFANVKKEVEAVAARTGMSGRYRIRAMMETMDAVMSPHITTGIARLADGISFGTNDLTSEFMGDIKRNDIAQTRRWMAEHNHVGKSPFLTLPGAVAWMMEEATKTAREANPSIEVGICGRQVEADAASIAECQRMGLDSMSVPASVAIMAPSRILAARAAINHPRAQEAEAAAGFAAKHLPRHRHQPDGTGWSKEQK